MSTEANEKILALVKPGYLERIPEQARDHATSATCQLIQREHPEAYVLAEGAAPLTEEAATTLSHLVNQIFEERMAKHHF